MALETPFTDAQLAGILDIADDAIISIDEHQHIVLFNKGAERIFGYTSAEAIGQPLEMLLPARARALHVGKVDHFAQGAAGARRMGERALIAGQRRSGEEFPAEASISRIEVGGRRMCTAIVRDVTLQHRQAEMLQAAKHAAEMAVHAKSMFLANMSHEIRTPLNAIIGMTSLLLHTGLADEQRDFAETIRSSGDALLALVNDILDFTRIELGSLELDIRAFDLRRTIEGALDLVASGAAAKGINLAYFLDDGVPPVVVSDGSRLRQVLLNVLSNAVKFTPAGEVVVTVESAPAGETEELHFAVRDTGIGIAEPDLEKLFRPFSQVDASTTREYGGTGLGLAISQRLTEMLGGRIWVESTPGHGSTFHFTALVRKAVYPPAVDLTGPQPLLAGKRVLIVDDNTTNRRVLMKHMLGWGMLPHAVASAQEALDLVRHGQELDVAILDMSMPHMDGVTLARAIRQVRDARSLPLVMLSSMGQRPAGRAAEADDPFAAWLHKPIKLSQLLDVMMTVAGAGGAAAAPPVAPAPHAASGLPRLGERLPLGLLVAEDNATNRKVVLRILEHLGYRADVAENGHEVLAALDRRDYDVILMDIQMPDMDGLETTRRIAARTGQDVRRPKIIAMTANALRGDRERFLAAGMDGYLSKPLDVAALAAALEATREGPDRRVRDSSVHPLLDPAQVANLRAIDGRGTLLTEVAEHFNAEVPAGIANLRELAANGDGEQLARTAHKLASTALSCGAVRVAEACRQVERCGTQGQIWLCDGLIDRLEEEFAATCAALAQEGWARR